MYCMAAGFCQQLPPPPSSSSPRNDAGRARDDARASPVDDVRVADILFSARSKCGQGASLPQQAPVSDTAMVSRTDFVQAPWSQTERGQAKHHAHEGLAKNAQYWR